MRMDIEADMGQRGGFGVVRLADTKPRRNIPKSPRTVIVLMLAFTYAFKHSPADVRAIARCFDGYPHAAAGHSAHQVFLVIETDLTADQVVERARPALRDNVEASMAFTPGADVAGHLPFNTLAEKVARAWRNVRNYNRSLVTAKNLPPRIVTKIVEDADGRGRTETPILDDHPLRRQHARKVV